jgi:hypothetical protein
MLSPRELSKPWLALAVVIGSLFVAFGGGSSGASAQEPAACPPNAVVRVIPPTDDEPSTVSVEVEPDVDIKPAADADPESFHLHYFVDVDPGDLAPGEVIPAGNPNIIHSAATELDLELPSGEHQVWVVLGQLGHQACGTSGGSLAVGSTQFTVPAGSGANELAAADEDDDGSVLAYIIIGVAVLAAALGAAFYMANPGRRRGRGI